MGLWWEGHQDWLDKLDGIQRDGGEIAEKCEEQLKVVIELLTALVNNKNQRYLCCETNDCDHVYGEGSAEYVEEDDNTFWEVTEGEVHEQVHSEGEMHEGAHGEGEMHVHVQGEGGTPDSQGAKLPGLRL